MTNISQDKDILEYFLKLFDGGFIDTTPQYNGSKLTLKFKADFEASKTTIAKVFSEVNTLIEDTLEVKLSSCIINNTSIFFGAKDFIQKYENIKGKFLTQNIIIIDSEGNHAIKKPNEGYKESNKLIHNIHEYKQTLTYFINTPEFAPYVSDIDSQFTLISKTHGVFNIGYLLPEISFFEGLNLNGIYLRFQEQFEKKEFIQFFKEIVITGIHNTAEENRYNEIIKQHNSLLNLAKRDYETYVSNFAFDKIKSEFKEEREKYFETIDRNISSIGKQVVSFPLTFGATIFASYKVKDQPEFLVLILGAYSLYAIIAFLILNMTAYNVKCLRKDVEEEEEEIKKSYKVIYEGFKKDFKKIKHKIFNLRVIIGVLFSVLIILLLLFTAFTFHFIDLADLQKLWQEYWLSNSN